MFKTKVYKANFTGWIAGQRVSKGDPLKLTEMAARYENVTLDKAATKAADDAAKAAAEAKNKPVQKPAK